MTRAKIVWHGKKFTKDIKQAAMQGAEDAAKYLAERCKEAVSTPFPPSSEPGEPPHMRTGTGRDSIMWISLPEKLETHVIVSEEGRYMLELEIGTHRYAARPWLRPTFHKYKDTLRDLGYALLRRIFK